MAQQTQNVLLEEAYVAITNALNVSQLQEPLRSFGYDEAKLRGGLAHHTTVKQLTQQREGATQTARETSALYQRTLKQLTELFQLHRDTARLAYKREAQYIDHLKLTARRKDASADMLAQAETFYANVPVAMMEKYRISAKEIAETAKLVTQVRDLKAMRTHTQSQVQSLTRARNQALSALQTWMSHFMTIAKIALEQQPQQLEALNRTVAS